MIIRCTADALYSRPLATIDNDDVDDFGSRNAALGEMIRHMDAAGLWVPKGFAVSASGYKRFMRASGVDTWSRELVSAINANGSNIAEIGAVIRGSILSSRIPADLSQEIAAHYRTLVEEVADWPLPVAVLTSPTPDHLAEAAFGGRRPASLFVQDADSLIEAFRRCYASLYTDRAIAYRFAKGISHDAIGLAIAVQAMTWANAGRRSNDAEIAEIEAMRVAAVNLDMPRKAARHAG